MEENTNNEELLVMIAEDEIQRISCNQDFLFTIIVKELNGMAAPEDKETLISKSVVVVLGGAILSGLLISGTEYGRIFINTLKDGYRNANIIGGSFSKFSEEDINVMVSSYEEFFNDVYKKNDGKKLNDFNTTYFHMKDVVIKYPDGSLSKLKMFRGKIKDVNGFTMENG